MKKIIFLFLILSSGFVTFSQNTKLTNTLLWRISGKQLTRPSYLYGTMHLTDKRVFQLGDSVYKALEQTDGFAAELDMNRIGVQMINQFIKEAEDKAAKEPVKVKDIVSAEVWDLYKDQLSTRFNKKADKITLDDLDGIEKKLQADQFKKGDMPSFLDAWLFGQARRQGKWVGGIEEMEDQLEHTALNSSVEDKIQMALFDDKYYGSGIESFIKTYTNQQLDSIDAYMYRASNGSKDYIMIKRNLKMARRMDSLSAIRSTLFAVGAAHLPGDSGVVALLRSRGFTVTPVISSTKINPDKYVSKTTVAQWMPVLIKDSSYTLQMPGVADRLEMLESMGVDMKMFFDISFMKMYMTLGMEISDERKGISHDSLYKTFKKQYTEKGKMISEKQISINGTAGREYRISTGDGEMKMQILLPAMERVILNAVFAFKEKSLLEGETEKFFQSFVYNYNKPKIIKTERVEKVWNRMDFPLQSFSVEIPVKPKETKDVISEEGKIVYSWQGIDLKGAVFYGMRAALMKEGMYDAGDDTTYFISIKDNLKLALEGGKVLDSAFYTMDNYPAYKAVFNSKSEGDLIETKIILVRRGGIGYYLYAVYQPTEANKVAGKRFLNSFRLLPYNQHNWKPVILSEKSFSISSPFLIAEKENIEDDIHPDAKRYIIYDSLAAVTTYIDKTTLPYWYWYNSDTAFLRRRSAQYSTYSDSVANYKVFKIGNLPAVSFTIIRPGDNIIKKVQLVLNGDELYELFGNYARRDMQDMNDRYFDDFKVLNERKGSARAQSKINELSTALKGADKKTANEIKLWWDDLEFTKADIPILQKLALTIYPDFDSTYYHNLNSKIFDKIEEIDSSHTTIDFIKSYYALIESKDEYIKPLVLSYLSGIKTAASYSVLKECLMKYSFALGKSPYYKHSLYDSLQLTAMLYPDLMQLAGKESMWGLVSGIATSLLDDSLLNKNTIRQYSKQFIESSKRILEKDKDDVEEDSYNYADLIRILGIINTPESNSLLARFAKFNNREIRFRTLIAMLENNQPVDIKTITTLATTDKYRHDLYDELKRMNKLKLFPAAYLTQKELGKSKLYDYATDEEAPQFISDAGTRTILYNGKQQKFYLFKVSFSEDESTWYLGVAGPYAVNPKDFTSNHDVTGVYWEKEFNPKIIDTLFKEYLVSLEEYNETEIIPPPPPAQIIKN